MEADFVTVFTCLNPMDAELVASRLSAAGLKPEVFNQLSALSMEGYSLATGGIQVKVPAAQGGEAKAILAADEEAAGGAA
ncbi:MAG: putative signal transducing protein [Limisphaerales bacterium]